MEGHYESHDGAPLILFGIPHDDTATIDYEISIPHLSSLIMTHSWNGHTPGLTDFKPEDRPSSEILFWTFRIMVGMGSAMVALGFFSLYLRWKKRLYDNRYVLWSALAMGPSGLIALLDGWVTTEVGRQPYTIYGILRTDHSVSPVGTPGLAISLAAFVVVYLVVFGGGIGLLIKTISKPPAASEV